MDEGKRGDRYEGKERESEKRKELKRYSEKRRTGREQTIERTTQLKGINGLYRGGLKLMTVLVRSE